MGLVQVIIDDSTDKVITGTYEFDSSSGGVFIISSGTSFPGSPTAKELFWRTDEDKLYRRNDGNTAWDAVAAAPTTHTIGGGSHSADTLANFNAKISDATLDDSSSSRTPTSHATSHESGGADEVAHQDLSGAGTNTHSQIDTHVASTSNPHSVTKTQVSLGNVTDDAQLKRSANDFSTFTEKGTPADADLVLIEDSAAAGVKKKVQVSNLGGGGGLSEADHKTLRQAIHFIDHGPAEGFASGAYRETTGTVFPTAIVWWESSSKLQKIFEKNITWSGAFPQTEVWKIYNDSGTLLATMSDAITYSGAFETNRTRTITIE